ncbi:MAG: hypothetical protein AB7O24_31165 [Kofleriaceae bacterium]
MRWACLVLCVMVAGCKSGGEYKAAERPEVDSGETDGRMFDFVTNKPDGEDWQIRIRGSSLWAAYSEGDATEDLGARNLTAKETKRVWKLIDALDVPERDEGTKDEDEGFVVLRLRVPGGDDGHDIYTAYVSRGTDDDDVIELAEYLQDLIGKYHKETPNF